MIEAEAPDVRSEDALRTVAQILLQDILEKRSVAASKPVGTITQPAPSAQVLWHSPMVIAIVSGMITLMVAIVSHAYDNARSREGERAKRESDLIIKAIDTGDPAKALNNLAFLVRVKLISDPSGAIQGLRDRPQETPVLPGAAANQLGNDSWTESQHTDNLLDFDKKQQQALAGYRNAASANPSEPIFHINVGTSLSRLGRYSEAVQELRKGLSLGGNEAWYYDELCIALRRLGLAADAKASCDTAIQLDPKFKDFQPQLEAQLLDFDRQRTSSSP